MNQFIRLVVFAIEGQPFALRLPVVGRVVRAVETTSLPKAPEVVLGIVNVRGEIVPVFNMRKRLRLPEREMNLGDRLIVARTARRTVALVADAVTGVVERREPEIVAAEKILPGLEFVEGVVKLEDGLIFIHNLERFLSLEEEDGLETALQA